jgi:bifunctional DNA-binding transcriptional regulator/antitoxin component of YhaV-PrlF toxin-antitoxin module
MRITSRGQVTIPMAMRKRAGLSPHTEVEVEFDGEAVRIAPVNLASKEGRGGVLVAHVRGKSRVAMSTDEIMALTRGE